MSFGETILKKFGWEKGKGLGREENGISVPVKVKLKNNAYGIGYNYSESEFGFQWWDHAYNKVVKNISVSQNETGRIQISKEKDFKISTKLSSIVPVDGSYEGHFVKSSVTADGKQINTGVSEKEESLELIKKLTDEELLKSCGGLTAHKAARHGFKMSAKLARLEEQDKLFALSVDSNPTKNSDKIKKKMEEGSFQRSPPPFVDLENLVKKRKLKFSNDVNGLELSGCSYGATVLDASSQHRTDSPLERTRKKRKKAKKRKDS